MTYVFVFWLMTLRHYKSEPQNVVVKKSIKDYLYIGYITGLCLCFAFCVSYQYPEMEYKAMKLKYESISFSEEVDDYRFYTAYPFQDNNILATLDEPSTLQFDELETTPRLDGATAFYPIYSAFVQAAFTGFKEYAETSNGDYYLFEAAANSFESNILSCTKTSAAYNRLVDKQVDMIFAFEPSESQIAAAEAKGEKFVLTPLGYDAFCFFVNTNNPVNTLTVEQVRNIYKGKIKNWKKVGGKNKRIMAFTRPANSGSQTIMENSVMQGEKINTRYQAFNVRTMGGMIRVIDSYLNTPAAIGYTFMYYSTAMVTSDKIKYIAINNVPPNSETVRNRTYAFSETFYAITLESNDDSNTAALLDWVTGPQGQEIVAKTGYLAV